MTEQELIDQIRAGVTQEMESALTADINPVLMHAVTQSYLLLKILDKLDVLIYRTEVIFHKIGHKAESEWESEQ